MTTLKSALLFGATGLIGHQLLQQALADGTFHVTAVTRRPLAFSHVRLGNRVTDFSGFDRAQWPQSVDVAFSCLGTTIRQAGSKEAFYAIDHDLAVRCAQWAKQLGAMHFLAVSAVGVGRRSPVFYNRVKAETEQDLEQIGFPRLTLMQPALLQGEREGPSRPAEAIGSKLAPLIDPLLIGPLSDFRSIQAAEVARAMLVRAKRPGAGGVERLRWSDIRELNK